MQPSAIQSEGSVNLDCVQRSIKSCTDSPQVIIEIAEKHRESCTDSPQIIIEIPEKHRESCTDSPQIIRKILTGQTRIQLPWTNL